MSGVIRPYTLVDILNTIYQATVTNTPGGQVIVVAIIVEDDEVATATDSAIALSTTPFGWDQGTWGSVGWN